MTSERKPTRSSSDFNIFGQFLMAEQPGNIVSGLMLTIE